MVTVALLGLIGRDERRGRVALSTAADPRFVVNEFETSRRQRVLKW